MILRIGGFARTIPGSALSASPCARVTLQIRTRKVHVHERVMRHAPPSTSISAILRHACDIEHDRDAASHLEFRAAHLPSEFLAAFQTFGAKLLTVRTSSLAPKTQMESELPGGSLLRAGAGVLFLHSFAVAREFSQRKGVPNSSWMRTTLRACTPGCSHRRLRSAALRWMTRARASAGARQSTSTTCRPRVGRRVPRRRVRRFATGLAAGQTPALILAAE